MTTRREGVNPLRPYYVPPSIGEPSDPSPSPPLPNPFRSGRGGPPPGTRYASKARDIFTDLDYKAYIGEAPPSFVRTVKELVDDLIWKYTSALMAQPFEVAKTVMQVYSNEDLVANPTTSTPVASRHRDAEWTPNSRYRELEDSDSEADEPAYFTSNFPETPTPAPRVRSPRSRASTPQSNQISATASNPYYLQLDPAHRGSVLDVISKLWQKEGAFGVWKGSNATFLYSILQSVLENWSRSFLSAMFNVPDLGVPGDLDRLVDIASPYPWASLAVAATAAAATGLLLAPLDLVRTRLLVTPSTSGPRRTLATLRSLPSYFCPSSLAVPTILHSLVHPIFALSTPLVLQTQFMIDNKASPTIFSLAKFVASVVAIFVKLPLETVLRRGQVAVLKSRAYLQAIQPGERRLQSVVATGPYAGAFGTMYHIVAKEGHRMITAPTQRPSTAGRGAKGKSKVSGAVFIPGQGIGGLWLGWRVSWWGLVGLWAAGVVGNGGEGEF